MALTLPSLLDRLANEEVKRIRAEQRNAHPGQQDCDVCGLVEAGCFGFGKFKNTRGISACIDPDCRAEAKSRASGQRNLIAAE